MSYKIVNYQNIVIKIGSSSLTHPSGMLDLWKMEKLIKQIANLYNSGKSIIIVSSGAIAAGMGKLKMKERPSSIPEKQAAAAVGQSTLMHMYEKFFSEYGITVAQVLLTKEDIYEDSRRSHCMNALNALIAHQIIPIINENDVVAIDEIKVGDNDTLSADVCNMIDFDSLIILSDINGVYNRDPRKHEDAVKIDLIDNVKTLDEIDAGGSGSSIGTGGMQTKFNAARIIASQNRCMFIVNSETNNVLNEIFYGTVHGTFFNFTDSKNEVSS